MMLNTHGLIPSLVVSSSYKYAADSEGRLTFFYQEALLQDTKSAQDNTQVQQEVAADKQIF